MASTNESQAEAIFHEVLDQDPADREAFLDRQCAGHQELRNEVESLLAADESAGEFLHSSALGVGASKLIPMEAGPDTSQLALPVGVVIGRYRIIDVIASGGMGTVYQAVRADDAYEKMVAIKLIRRGMGSEAARRRFQRERQTLARLEHPYITRLIDGGATSDGQPYLVMEYVQGTPINRYCDENRLPIAQRLKLFGRICEAVHCAHQNLIVHRDLKPNNILITADGVPKLLDFGISKLLHSDLAEESLEATVTLFRALTPRYASPEQIHNSNITTASDVYSLGVLLYELLTGHRPYQLDHRSGLEQERIVCEQNPCTPSVVVGRLDDIVVYADTTDTVTPDVVGALRGERTDQLRRRLRGDLDNIVMMAMRKEPSERYASVQQLAEDLDRFLQGLPVIARKHSLTYRTVKFVQRNRVATVAAFAVLLALSVGGVGTLMGLRQAQRERNVAVKVSGFLQDVLQSANPYRTGRDANEALALLAEASARIGDEFTGRPAAEAAVRYAIANTYAGLWLWAEAESHLRVAVDLNRKLHGDSHPSVATCLSLLGRALTFQFKAESIGIQREALATRLRHFAEDNVEVAWSKTCLAFALWHGIRVDWQVPNRVSKAAVQRWQEAERLSRASLGVLRPLRSQEPIRLAIALHTLAVMLADRRGEGDECLAIYEEAIEIYKAHPEQKDRYLPACLRAYGTALARRGRLEEQEQALREFLTLTPRTFRADEEARRAIWHLAARVYQRASASAPENEQALLREAESFYWKAITAEFDHWAQATGQAKEWHQLADAGHEDRIGGPPRSAIGVLAARTQVIPNPMILQTANRLAGFARLLIDSGQSASAERLMDSLLSLDLDRYSSDAGHFADTTAQIGDCLRRTGKYIESEKLLQSSLRAVSATPLAGGEARFPYLERLVRLYQDWGKPFEAEKYREMMKTGR